jgi:hypothetical protein
VAANLNPAARRIEFKAITGVQDFSKTAVWFSENIRASGKTDVLA